MSKEINNKEYRANFIKELLLQLHEGKSVDELKQRFAETFDGVSASEIADAERTLIEEGMPVEEVQRLCDIHAAVFEGSVEQIHAPHIKDASGLAGHPIHTLIAENRAIKSLVESRIRPHIQALRDGAADNAALYASLRELSAIDKHYSKKENLFFPYLEKRGITAPPKVMWGVDDNIRAAIKRSAAFAAENADAKKLADTLSETLDMIGDMISKEENILVPMLSEALSPDEWHRIAQESAEIGFCLIDTPPVWEADETDQKAARTANAGGINFPTGILTPQEITRLLDTLPVDITFVGDDDTVRYFSQGAERVFPRTKAIIGRKVIDCHPPASMHIVEGIINDFKAGKKEHEDFWIHMGEKYVFIRYFAVRGEGGEYLGTLEVTQDIAPLQEIEGEKRLVT